MIDWARGREGGRKMRERGREVGRSLKEGKRERERKGVKELVGRRK